MISQAVELGRNYAAVGKVARALDICNADGLTIRLATTLRKVSPISEYAPSDLAKTVISVSYRK
jgi:hypothetical protein